MEHWFKSFQEAEVKTLEEAARGGLTNTQIKMDKQFAAILLKATFTMSDLRNNVELYLQQARDRCREEWEDLNHRKVEFEIEKSRAGTEMRKTVAARQQWEGKKQQLDRQMQNVQIQSREYDRLRQQISGDVQQIEIQRQRMDEKQRELYKLYEEHEREKTQTQQEIHNIASEKERLSKKSQELDEKERNLEKLQNNAQ
eukprot:TRINITY_DN10546_c0_g1_i1.p1 TRINITY_DN10546_c0_g1~~TRINITY_DN10546_c0_g1_i1.p1  ORF type:complete len:199 (+),score=42.20 TRINITY_DN10546_c0_g1_i1:96-692(+)